MTVEIIVVTSAVASTAPYQDLLTQLDLRHQLHDSHFAGDTWRDVPAGGDGRLRLVLTRDGRALGFLGGNPASGHISVVGAVEPCNGVGAALLETFADYARESAAGELTVVLDSEARRRWDRRRFFIRQGFTARPGSALHFVRPTPGAWPVPSPTGPVTRCATHGDNRPVGP